MPWTLLMGGVLYLLYDSMAYKLYEDDVGRIERETGTPVRDLSEVDLVAAMKRLGIQRLELPPEDTAVTSPSPKRAVSYCSSCGNALSYDAVYCEQCGRKIERR
jgi:hypothetical protein